MSVPITNIDNARDPEQIRRMKLLHDAGLCYFCKQGSAENKTLPQSIYDLPHWYAMKNDMPYTGSVHHYLIVPKRHITDAENLSDLEKIKLFEIVAWLKKHLDVNGYSLFIRSGDMTLTGATLGHVHFHFLVGGPKPEGTTLDDVVPVVLAYKKR